MSSFRDTLRLFKRRAGYNTDVDTMDIAAEKVAKELGISKEALLGTIARIPLGAAAKGLEGAAGWAVANPFRAMELGFMGHMAKGEADQYQKMTRRRFSGPAKGLGRHD